MIIGVVLAGGKGARMGGAKPLYPFGGKTLIEHAIERLTPQVDTLCVNAGEEGAPQASALASSLTSRLATRDVPLIYDDPALCNLGPLSGIHRGLKAAMAVGAGAMVSLPCDMPDIPPDMVQNLMTQQALSGAAIIHIKGDSDYPLCALWSPEVLSDLTEALRASATGLGVMRFLGTQRVATVAPANERAYVNINTPQDVA